jgi:hypothetical protein
VAAVSAEKLTEPQFEAMDSARGSVKKINQKKLTAKITTALMQNSPQVFMGEPKGGV